MKKLMFAVLLAVIPSALRAQLASLENIAGGMTAAEKAFIENSYGLTAVPFDGAVTEGGSPLVVADNSSIGSNKKNVPLIDSRKINLRATMPGISKKTGLGIAEAPGPEKIVKSLFLSNQAAEYDLSTSIVLVAYFAMFVWLAMAFISLLV